MLEFAYPWLFLLLPLPWLLRRWLPVYRESRPAVRAPFVVRLERVMGKQAGERAPVARRRAVQWLLLACVWLLLVAALARPQWLGEAVSRDLPMRDMLVAVDLSGSMETQDFTDNAGQRTDRLTATKEVLDDFLSRREGDRVGLILFGSTAFIQAPFTDDLSVVRELLGEAQVRMLGPRTVIGDAIGLSIPLFERSEVDERVLIVLTDGNDTGSLVPPDRAAKIAADNGVVVHTVAMGDPQAAGEQALDEATLKTVAATTGGQYFRAEDRDGLESVYEALDQLNPRKVERESYRPRHELFHWPLGAAIILNLGLFGASGLLPGRRARPGEAA